MAGAGGRLLALVRKNWKLLFRRMSAAATALELLLPIVALLALGLWKVLASSRDVPDGWSAMILGPPSTAALDGGDGGLLDSIFGDLPMTAEPLSLFAQLPNSSVPRFIAQETSMPGLLVSLVERAVKEAQWYPDARPRPGLNITQCAIEMLAEGRISSNSSATNALPSSCGGWMAPHRLAIVPEVPFTKQYLLPVLAAWYPSLALKLGESSDDVGDSSNESTVDQLVIPGIEDVVTFFESEDELEAYVRNDSYGANASSPKIHAALVFHEYPTDEDAFGTAPASIEYSIRLSSAAGNAVATASDDGHEEEQLWNPLRDHQVLTEEYTTYALEGFATLQSLVARFVNCRPVWNATGGELVSSAGDGANATAIASVVCGQNGSSADTTDDTAAQAIDNLLLEALQSDVKLNSSWQLTQSLQRTRTSNSSMAKVDFNMTAIAASSANDTRQSLLAPMHVMPQPLTGSRLLAMPVSRLHASAFYDRSRQVFPLAVTGAYLFPVAKMIATYVGESESQARTFLRTRGVRDRDMILSWFAAYGLLLALSALLQLVVVSAFGIFSHSSAVLVLALLALYAWCLWCYAFAMSACVSGARAGAYVGVLVLVTLLFLDQRLLAHLGPSSSGVVNLLAPLAAARGIRALLAAESMQRGISWHNLDQLFGGAALSESLTFLVLDCVLYTLLGLYLERVLLKRSGEGAGAGVIVRSPDPWYFPLLPSFWFRCCWPSSWSSGKSSSKSDEGSSDNAIDGPATVPSSVVTAAYGSADGALADGIEVVGDRSVSDPSSGRTGTRGGTMLSPLGSPSVTSSLTTSTTRMQSGARFLHLLHPRRGQPGDGSELHQEEMQQRPKSRKLYLHRVTAGVSTIRGGYKTVLDGINLRLSTGKISCILGPKSSGKSTLMSVLMLRTPQTSGVVTLSESTLPWPQYAASHSGALGFCFQSDVHFPELTVLDHLEFYAHLTSPTNHPSGGDVLRTQRTIDRQLRQFELLHLSDTKAKNLTAGARRSLSLAIALMSCDGDDAERSYESRNDVGDGDGGVRFVFLDDPTRGMGPLRRQRTWDILRSIIHDSQEEGPGTRHRRQLGIVIATSEAEEAEAIGDEISILTGGKTTIVGSPAELKQRTRAGYSLSFVKGPAFREHQVMELITTTCCVPGGAVIQVTANSASEFAVCIPPEHSSSFSTLFQRLETQYATALGATAYSLSLTTLDDAVSKVVDNISLRTIDPGRSFENASQTHDQTINIEEEDASLPQSSGSSGGVTTTAGVAVVVASQTFALAREQLAIAFKRRRARTLAVVCTPVAVLFALLAATGAFSKDVRSPSISLSTTALREAMAHSSGNVESIHVPFYCHSNDNGSDSRWCSTVFASSQWDSSTVPSDIGTFLPLTGEDDANSVQLFGVNYSTDDQSELMLLQLQWQLFLTGFAADINSSAAVARKVSRNAVTNQLAAYLVTNSSWSGGVFSFDTVVNTSVPHAAGIFKAQMHQAIIRAITGDASVSLTVHNHPLPFSRREQFFSKLQDDGVTTNAFLVSLAFSYLPATIVWRLAASRRAPSSTKYQRLLGGMKMSSFWLANFAVDVLLHVVSATIFVLVLLVVRVASWYGDGDNDSDEGGADPFGAMVVLIFLFGFAVCPFAYGLSIVFTRASATSTTRLVHIYAFMLFAVLSYLLFLVTGPMERAGAEEMIAFQNFFSFVPQFALGFGLYRLGHERREDALISGVEGDAGSMTMNPFADTITGVSILYLVVTSVLYLAIVVALDTGAVAFVDVRGFLTKSPYHPDKSDTKRGDHNDREYRHESSHELSVHVDPRVQDEARRVEAMLNRAPSQGDSADPSTNGATSAATERFPVVLVHGVSKVFVSPRSTAPRRRHRCMGFLSNWLHGVWSASNSSQEVSAVRDVSFHVERGECLAVFGANDSGKSTLMQILSGHLLPTRGRIVIAGTDVIWNQQQLCARRTVGYCPAQDSFLQDELSVRDHILTHARLKEPGKTLEQYNALAAESMTTFGLSRLQHRLAGALLVGERRRLCLALAVLGAPDVLLLDDPTLGLEGKARQQVWTLLRRMVNEGRCQSMVVATSSLAECQALADRVGIMSDGSLVFIDTFAALERDFEYGWVLDVRPAPPTLLEVHDLMRLAFFASNGDSDASISTDWSEAAAGLVVYPGQLESVFAKLGRADWVQRISADHPTGCWIAGTLSLGQPVAVPSLLRWWVGELRHEALAAATEQTFGDEYVRLLRREPAACRFQLLFDDAELKLSQVFKVLETAKQRNVIESYAVSPASFASVADTFARTARAQRLLRHAGPLNAPAAMMNSA